MDPYKFYQVVNGNKVLLCYRGDDFGNKLILLLRAAYLDQYVGYRTDAGLVEVC